MVSSKTLVTGSLLMLLTKLSIKSIGLVSSLILAKLLLPNDFGIVAIAMAIYAFIDLFGSFGFSTVIIQKSNPGPDDYNTAWTISFLFGLFSSLLLLFSASFLSEYFNEPRLADAIFVIAISSIVSGSKNIAIIDLQRNLQFKEELKFQLAPKILSFICTMFIAFQTRNFLALVIGGLIHQTLITITSYIMKPYLPKFCLSSFKSMFNFSKWIFLNNLIFYVNNRFVELIIGKNLGANFAGIFSLSNEIASTPIHDIAAPFNRASFPVYSRLKNDENTLKIRYFESQELISIICSPICAGISAIMPFFIPLVLGDNWRPAIDVITLLSLASIFICISTNNGYLFIAKGMPRIATFTSAIRALTLILFILIFSPTLGLIGVGFSFLISSFIYFIATTIAAVYYFNLSALTQLKYVIRPAIAAYLMYFFAYLFSKNIEINFQNFLLTMAFGAVTYLMLLFASWLVVGKPNSAERKIANYITSKWKRHHES